MEGLLDLLLGRFTGVDELHPSPWADEQTATVEIASTAEMGGALIVMRINETRASGTFEAVNVFTTDRESGELLLYGFDSLGYPPEPPARGRFDGGVLVLDRSTVRGDSRTTFARTPTGLRWSKQFRPTVDAPWQPVVTGTLTRASDPAG
jgi:hypothetical protein